MVLAMNMHNKVGQANGTCNKYAQQSRSGKWHWQRICTTKLARQMALAMNMHNKVGQANGTGNEYAQQSWSGKWHWQ
jgi:hypothetical protein